MKLLFLSLTFPDARHPARGIYNLELAAALIQHAQVEAIAPRSWYEWLASRAHGQHLHASAYTDRQRVPAHFPVFFYVPRLMSSSLGTSLWWSIRPTVDRIAAIARPDAVVSYWAFPDGAAGVRAARQFGVPSILIVGGSDVLLSPHEAGRGPAFRRALREFTGVAAVSDGLRRACVDLGVPEERVRTIRQGINPDVFFAADRTAARIALDLPLAAEILLWVGRMVPVKNMDLLLSAAQTLVSSRPGLRLFLLGDGPLRGALEARVRERGLSEHVRFQGAVTHEALADWYRAADVTVLSSHSEGLPNVLRESLACGTPFVATDVGSVREIAHPDYSRLVLAGDAAQFAAAVAEVLTPSFRDAAARYRPRTWTDCAADLLGWIEELHSQRSPPLAYTSVRTL